MNEAGSSSLALTISAKVAKRYRISGSKVNGRVRVGAARRGYSRAGKQKFAIKIYKKAGAKLKRLPKAVFIVYATSKDRAGNIARDRITIRST